MKASEIIKKINPKSKIIWGGTHATFFPKETAESRLVDIVSYGEGEETFYEIASGQDLAGIKGIVYKNGQQIIVNQPRNLVDIQTMPLFNWNLMPLEILEKLCLVPSLTSRGCPHRCTFCLNAILKNRWRARTVEQVLEDLKVFKSWPYFSR